MLVGQVRLNKIMRFDIQHSPNEDVSGSLHGTFKSANRNLAHSSLFLWDEDIIFCVWGLVDGRAKG